MSTILHLITGLETGGAEQALVRLAPLLGPRHRSVVVSMTRPGPLAPALAAAGIEVWSLGLRRGRPDPRGLARFAAILRRVRPDIMQTWLYHADLLGTLARLAAPRRCRLLWNVRCTETTGLTAVRKLLCWLSPIPEAVVVNSRAGRRFHEQIGYRPRRWVLIPNGCDTAAFRFDAVARQALRQELAIGDNQVVIGMAARMDPMKDHENFLAAAGRVAASRPEAIFVLAGDGVDGSNRAIAAAIARRGIEGRVRLLGRRSDMPRVYSALDVASLSSAFGEGCPNMLLEAMACGIPCVATDCGDAAELIGPHGIIVPPRDPQALAAAWERVMALGSGERRHLGAAARQRVAEHYDLAAVAARYDELYRAPADRSHA
jgi:glycosyltransferase involved in cell wall biosynthesis